MANALPVELVEPVDISNAVLWLVSDEARYVTGVDAAGRRRLHDQVRPGMGRVRLPVDTGCTIT